MNVQFTNLSRAVRARGSRLFRFPGSGPRGGGQQDKRGPLYSGFCASFPRKTFSHDDLNPPAAVFARQSSVWNPSQYAPNVFFTSRRAGSNGPLVNNTRRAAYSSQSDGISEIEFNPVAANTINIIGNVGRQPEIKYLESGSKVTNFPVAFTDRKDGDTQWFDVEAWDDLADVASLHVSKGERVALQGRLKVQDWTDREGNTRKSLRIVAQTIQKVKRNMSIGGYDGQNMGSQSDSRDFNAQIESTSNQQTDFVDSAAMTSEELWMSFFENSSGWYDNRQKKQNGSINPKSPDFKRIEGGRDAPALWIESKTTPAWVKTELSKLDRLQGDIPPF